MILTGCIRDEHDPRDRIFRPETGALFGSGDVDLRPYCPEVWDQLANDCVLHGLTAAKMIVDAVAGRPVRRPSVLYGYGNSRRLGGTWPIDAGTNCRSALKGMSGKTALGPSGQLAGLGMVPEEDFSETVENINAIPPDDLFQKGALWTIDEYFRLPEGVESLAAIDAALDAKIPVTLCLIVDEAFANIGQQVYHGNDGSKVLGGHCVLCVGRVAEANAYRYRNSWGPEHGIDGYGLIDRGTVANHVYDIWGIR